MTEEQQEEPLYICLNYCVYDQETGYCLTCGRPPLPPPTLDFGQKTFAGLSFSGTAVVEPAATAPVAKTPTSEE